MSIGERVNADIVTAMKAKEEHRLTTLRMVKSALKSKEIDKRRPLTETGPRDMGAAMKVVQQRILATGLRADGKMVAEMVKAELAK